MTSFSRSVLPFAMMAFSTIGMMLVVVLPTSIMTQLSLSCEIIQPVAAQFADATFNGSALASGKVRSFASTSRTSVVVVGNAFSTCVRMWFMPSRLVRYASASSAVMVTVTRSMWVEGHSFFVSFMRVFLSFSGFFQTGKYSESVLSFWRAPFFVVMNAALVFAPPMSKPITFTVVVCLRCLLWCAVVFLRC